MDTKFLWLRYFSLGIFMIAILLPFSVHAQFEQKLSLNVSAGYFNTIGWNGHENNWEDHGPSLMPNFKGGPSISAGLQYNFSRHFAMEFQLGFRFAPGWYFDASADGVEAFNYLDYVIEEAIPNPLANGENYMDMTHIYMGVAPRYYLIPGSRINPFIYAGVGLSYLDVYYENNEKAAYKELDIIEQNTENPDLATLFDMQVGISLMAGAGAEYALNDTWGLFAAIAYHFTPMRDESYSNNSFLANYHDLSILLGARFSFLKSKTL